MQTLSVHADGWFWVYAVLLALSLLALCGVLLLALFSRRAPRPLRRTAAAICLIHLLGLVAMPLALALRAEQLAARFGMTDAGPAAIAWGAPVLALPCAAGALVALVLAALLLRQGSTVR